LEDGKRFKSLKRHLRTAYNMTPDEYRAKRGLPATYPMVAPAYAISRSQLAKNMGLGQKKTAPVAAPEVPELPVAVAAAVPVVEVVEKGRQRAKTATAEIVPEPVVADVPTKRRGRPQKAA
jgi:hypothetical protein